MSTRAAGFSVGDRVFVTSPHRHYAAALASTAFRLPDNISDEVAVFLAILGVGHIGVRTGRLELGQNVAIIGGGVIGLYALAFCRAHGLRTAVSNSTPDVWSWLQRWVLIWPSPRKRGVSSITKRRMCSWRRYRRLGEGDKELVGVVIQWS